MLVDILIPVFDQVTFDQTDEKWIGKINYLKFGEINVANDDHLQGKILYTKLFDLDFEKVKLFSGVEILKDNVLDEIPDGAISSVIIRHLENPVNIIKYKVPNYLFNEIFKEDSSVLINTFSISLKFIKDNFNLTAYNPDINFYLDSKHFDDGKPSLDAPTELEFLKGLLALTENTLNENSLDKLVFGKQFKYGDLPLSNLSAYTIFNIQDIGFINLPSDLEGKINDLKAIDKDFDMKVSNELVIKPSYLMVKYNCFMNNEMSNRLGVSTFVKIPDKYSNEFNDAKKLGDNLYSFPQQQQFKYEELDKFKMLLDACALRSHYDLSFFNLKYKDAVIRIQSRDELFMKNLPSLDKLKLNKNVDSMLSFLMPAL